MKKEIKKKEVKKTNVKLVSNPFATLFKKFIDFTNQKFINYFVKMNDNQTLFKIREDINNPIHIILYKDKDTNAYNIYIRVNNVANSFYLSNMSVQQDIYIYDNKKVLEQTVVKCMFVKGQTTNDLLRKSYDTISTNLLNIIDFFEQFK